MIIKLFDLCLQPQTVDEVTVDPVQDDIEIVNEGEGTDAFAVSMTFIEGSHGSLSELSVQLYLQLGQ